MIREFFKPSNGHQTEADYVRMVSGKWGKLPDDMTLDADGNPVVKAAPVPPEFRGIVRD